MKKLCFILALIMFCVGITSCNTRGGNDLTSSDSTKPEKMEVSKLAKNDDRTIIEYLGNPYLMYGCQIRLDNLRASGVYDINAEEEYFKKLHELNFQTVIWQLSWVLFETDRDKYDTFELDMVLKWCDKYDLNLQINWFGSDVCGSWTNVPKYILNDRDTYPRLPLSPETHLIYGTPALIERETNAVSKLFQFIEEKDVGFRVSMFQVENEPDNADSFKEPNGEKTQIPWNGTDEQVFTYLWGGGQAEASINMMDKIGQACKNSNRSVVTRANFVHTIFSNMINQKNKYLKKTFDRKYIDIVGIDIYSSTIEDYNKIMDYCVAETGPDNFSHSPESSGAQGTVINRVINSFARGEGYLLYELRGAVPFVPAEYDGGIFRMSSTEWIERDGTQQVPNNEQNSFGKTIIENKTAELRDFNKLIYKASNKLASLNKNRIAGFNIENKDGNHTEKGVLCDRYTLDYSTPSGGEAMAICDINGDLILLSLHNNSTFTVSGKTLSGKGSIGYFTPDGKWTEESSVDLSGASVTLPGVTCMKIPAEGIK